MLSFYGKYFLNFLAADENVGKWIIDLCSQQQSNQFATVRQYHW